MLYLQKKICEVIIEKKANYLFTVKNDNKARRREMTAQFKVHNPKCFETNDKYGGRIEKRELQVMDVPEHLKEWPGVQQILKLTRTRTTIKSGKTTEEVVYGITSLSKDDAPPDRIAALCRNHWGIENKLHWVRDTVFDEDRCTIRTGNAPQAMTALRNTVIALAHMLNMSVTDMRHEFARFYKRAIKVILEN